jgi:hypothetical protein
MRVDVPFRQRARKKHNVSRASSGSLNLSAEVCRPTKTTAIPPIQDGRTECLQKALRNSLLRKAL